MRFNRALPPWAINGRRIRDIFHVDHLSGALFLIRFNKNKNGNVDDGKKGRLIKYSAPSSGIFCSLFDGKYVKMEIVIGFFFFHQQPKVTNNPHPESH